MTRPTANKRKKFDLFLLLALVCIIGLTGLLAKVLITLPMGQQGLGDQVAVLQHQSGVESPVTAVLLNFRGYDTLLEVMVLLLAVIGVWSLTRAPFPPRQALSLNPVQIAVVRLLTTLMLLIAAYLVSHGSYLAGGAFQGGAVLGGAGVLLLVSELPWLQNISSLPLRLGLLCGPMVFLAVALFCLMGGSELLNYPQAMASSLLLLIESACAISIGLTLASLFAGGRPGDDLKIKKGHLEVRAK